MLYQFEEYGYYAQITGFKGADFKIADAYLKANRKEANQKVCVQFFEANLIATKEHLYFAVLNALLAFKNKTNLSKSLAMETMLYASSVRQIQKAIGFLGIKPETTNLAVVIIGEDPKKVEESLADASCHLGVETDDSVLDLSAEKIEKIKSAFEVTSVMLQAVSKNHSCDEALVGLVIERVALLATQL